MSTRLSVLLFRQIAPLHLDYVPLVLTIGACVDGPSLLRLFVALPSLKLSCFSGFLVCDIDGDLIPIDDLPDALLHCFLTDKPDNPPLWLALASISFLECPGLSPKIHVSNFHSLRHAIDHYVIRFIGLGPFWSLLILLSSMRALFRGIFNPMTADSPCF